MLNPEEVRKLAEIGAITPEQAAQLAPGSVEMLGGDDVEMLNDTHVAPPASAAPPPVDWGQISLPKAGPPPAPMPGSLAAKLGPAPPVAPPPPQIATTTSTFDPNTLSPTEAKSMGMVPPPAPMPPKPSGPPAGAKSLLAQIYTPAQLAGFGMKAEEMAEAGRHSAVLAEMQATKAGEDAQLVSGALDEAHTKIAQMQEAEAKRQEVRQAALASLDAKWDELGKTQIDPDRYWNNKDTGSKVMTTIALMLGGFRSGLQGGPNTSMQMLQSDIARDVDAQKANFSAKVAGARGKESVYGMMMQEFGDERMAEQASLATHWDMVGKQLNAIALTSESQVTKENALFAKNFADNQVAQYVAGIQANAELAYKNAQAQAAAYAAAERRKHAEAVFAANLRAAEKRATELGGAIGVDEAGKAPFAFKEGSPYFTGTEEGKKGGVAEASVVTGFDAKGAPIFAKVEAPKASAAKLTEANVAYANVKKGLADIRKLHEDAGYVYDTAAEKAKVGAAIGNLKLQVHKAFGFDRRFSAGVIEMLNSMVPSEGEALHKPIVFSDEAKAKLDTLEAEMDAQHENTLKGGIPAGPATESVPMTPDEE